MGQQVKALEFDHQDSHAICMHSCIIHTYITWKMKSQWGNFYLIVKETQCLGVVMQEAESGRFL